ncbi:MAG: DUF1570 domain-containing protein [Rubripirellula sp.]
MQSNRPAIRQIATVLLLITFSHRFCDAQTTGVVEFSAYGKMQKGILLVDLAHELIILGRDGWIHSLDPRSPESNWQRIEKEAFAAAPAAEIRNQLRSEFGPDYEVLSTKNFLVVQPRGRGDRWPKLFEQSHRSFISYMTKRGVKIRSGNFPMVAVVFPDESGMRHEFDRLDIDVGRVAGLYSVNSNRVMTHDGTRASSVMATVRHEAAHQSAFNSGAHSRINDTPRWITEGIGQMFEPAAMTDPRGATQLADRVNKESLQYLRQKVLATDAGRFVQTAMNLVSNDMMFKDEKQINEAYAVAWALMFYLAERQPKAFAKLLNETAGRRPFQTYQRRDRIADFERIVGMDTFEFSRKTLRYLESL